MQIHRGEIQSASLSGDVCLQGVREMLETNVPFSVLHCTRRGRVLLRNGWGFEKNFRHEHFLDSQNSGHCPPNLGRPWSGTSTSSCRASRQYLP